MNTNPIVYLAGPIAGLKHTDAARWRVGAEAALRERNIETLSPMRRKAELAYKQIATDFHEYEKIGAMFTSRGIMSRDFNDVKRCDALLVNLLGSERSFGTAMELAWAYALQIPTVVAVVEGSGYLTHPMLVEAMSFRVETLDEAIDTVAVVLGR